MLNRSCHSLIQDCAVFITLVLHECQAQPKVSVRKGWAGWGRREITNNFASYNETIFLVLKHKMRYWVVFCLFASICWAIRAQIRKCAACTYIPVSNKCPVNPVHYFENMWSKININNWRFTFSSSLGTVFPVVCLERMSAYESYATDNPRPAGGGGRICPFLVFQNNSKTVADINTKFGVPYPTLIWHQMSNFLSK